MYPAREADLTSWGLSHLDVPSKVLRFSICSVLLQTCMCEPKSKLGVSTYKLLAISQ